MRRLGAFLVVLAVCAGAGWQVGRALGPGLPLSGLSVPSGHDHH